MKLTKKISYAIIGFVLGSLFLFTIYFGFNNFNSADSHPEEISVDQAIILIKESQIKRVDLNDAEAILTNNHQKQFKFTIGTDMVREQIIDQITEYNSANSKNAISFSETPRNTSNPLLYLFQIAFILFIISPPIIAILLFLILKELKKRNKLK